MTASSSGSAASAVPAVISRSAKPARLMFSSSLARIALGGVLVDCQLELEKVGINVGIDDCATEACRRRIQFKADDAGFLLLRQ
jgi:hypothetical protein